MINWIICLLIFKYEFLSRAQMIRAQDARGHLAVRKFPPATFAVRNFRVSHLRVIAVLLKFYLMVWYMPTNRMTVFRPEISPMNKYTGE